MSNVFFLLLLFGVSVLTSSNQADVRHMVQLFWYIAFEEKCGTFIKNIYICLNTVD